MINRHCRSNWLLVLAVAVPACLIGDGPGDDTSGPSIDVVPDTAISASSVSITASADTFVRSGGDANRNFGSRADVQADLNDDGSVKRGFVRFTIGDVGTITRATIHMFVVNPSGNSANVFVTSNDWDEHAMTWNTQPAVVGGAIATLGRTSTSTWLAIDVTSAVTANSTVSFAIFGASTDGYAFSSKEAAANHPRLVIETAGARLVQADADTFVKSGAPDASFGTAQTVKVDGVDDADQGVDTAYLRFKVGDVGPIQSATLHLFTTNPSTSSGTVWTISSTDWSETSLTYNTRPALDGLPVADIGPTVQGQAIDIDVTSAVAANTTVSFALVPRLGDGFFFDSRENTHKPVLIIKNAPVAPAGLNPNCTLIVPAGPLSAQGLATPYQMVATDPAQGPCSETQFDQRAFVEAAVLDPATGQIGIYHPLIVDKGTSPAIAPVVPALPANAVVAIWFGYDGDTLTLQGATSTALSDGHCINGVPGSPMGQFADCNAAAFFAKANQLIASGALVPPPLGTAKDGLPCPSVRDFSIVDADQSDNVVTTYLLTGAGRLAQNTAANRSNLGSAAVVANPSDNRLSAVLVDGALGCTPWKAPDLDDPGAMTAALALDEMQAAAHQQAPVALVPLFHPFTLVDGFQSLTKLNLYRAGVDQPLAASLDQALTDQVAYCNNLLTVAPARLLRDKPLTVNLPSPTPADANNMFTFLAGRFTNFTWAPGGLNCHALLGKPSPIQVTTDANGVVIDATIVTP